MNKETRIEKISELLKQSPYREEEIWWENKRRLFPVYNVPLKYLIYNKYNGRILSRTKSLEAQGVDIKPEEESGKELIAKLLWDSKPDRNRQTQKDLIEKGQLKVGIITKDGIIIDGNRRAMLLNSIDEHGFFQAVILPVTLEENPNEIERLETTYQMGEDEKLDYNPIEKYLKSKDQQLKGISIEQTARWMGEKESVIEEYLAVMDTMNDYLDYLGYVGIYTQLDGREDQFINLTKWLKNFYGEGSIKAFDGYKNADVDDLKTIAFDYIRVKFEGKKFRYLGYGQKQSHFFGNKNIWIDFRDSHFKSVEPIQALETAPNLDSNNLSATLNERDQIFTDSVYKILEDNLDEHYTQLRYKQHEDEPLKLVTSAKRAITSINTKSKKFGESELLTDLDNLRAVITGMIQNASEEDGLHHIVNLMSSVDISKIQDKEKASQYLTEISSVAYHLKKGL